MNDTAFQRALRATARVAGAAALLGACAPGTVGPAIPDAPLAAVDTDVAEDTGDTDARATCDDHLDDLVADASTGERPLEPTAAQEDCCEALVDDIETSGEWPADAVGQERHWVCCEALGFPMGLACTPWGPPAPPALTRLA